MGDKSNGTEAAKAAETNQAPAVKELTAAQAAKRVSGKVRVIRTRDGKPVSKGGVFETSERALRAEDVLAFAERDGRVTVTTVDGQKLTEAA